MEFRLEWYAKGKFFDGSCIQKDGLETGTVYNWKILGESGMQKKMFTQEWYTKG